LATRLAAHIAKDYPEQMGQAPDPGSAKKKPREDVN